MKLIIPMNIADRTIIMSTITDEGSIVAKMATNVDNIEKDVRRMVEQHPDISNIIVCTRNRKYSEKYARKLCNMSKYGNHPIKVDIQEVK